MAGRSMELPRRQIEDRVISLELVVYPPQKVFKRYGDELSHKSNQVKSYERSIGLME